MTPEQLDAAVASTGLERLRWLTSADNGNARRREAYRARVVHLAGGDPAEYPPLARQAKNLAGAAARFVASGLAVVDREEYDRRRAVCLACPTGHYDPARDACRACGCYLAAKPWSKAEHCPDGHW